MLYSVLWELLRHTLVFTIGSTAASFIVGFGLALALNTATWSSNVAQVERVR